MADYKKRGRGTCTSQVGAYLVLPGLCINMKMLTDEPSVFSVQDEQHDWVSGRPFICACTSELRPPLEPGSFLSSFQNWERRGQRREVTVPRSQVDKVVVAAGRSRGSALQLGLDSHPRSYPKTSFHA